MSITIYEGSILDCKVDAIVNPANSFLNHGGGLARVIADAAGPDLWAESRKHPSIPTGGSVVTTAGKLPFKAVIHTVGPIWGGGSFEEEKLLTSAHSTAFNLAKSLGYESIALPAISCGLFRFPVEKAAPIAMNIANVYQGGLEIIFALMQDDHVAAYRRALANAIEEQAP